VVGGLLASYLFDFGARGVALVGDVPSGLPTFGIPSPSLMLEHADTAAVAAVALMLIGFSQTAGDARAFAAKHRYQIDVNQESVAQSAANIGSGVLHGMPVSTSLSASSLNDHSGAKTGLASITSGITVLLTLLFLAPLFSQLPKPVLGALIIEAVVMGMMNLPEMRRIYRVQKFDFWVAIAAIIGTLAFGVLAGVIIGIGLSLLWLVAVATHPRMAVLGREPGTQVFRDVLENPDDEQVPGVVVLRLDGGLFFATADALGDRVRALIQDPDVRCVVFDCEGINFLDSQGSASIDDLLVLCRQADVTLRLARVKPAVRATLEREGTIERLGTDHLHGNVHRAVEAQLSG
jgi:anti-anti-sigma factor